MPKSHPVDVHVGARMRQRRRLLGMNQTAVGKAVNLTFQQIQKYERGSNRIGSSRLFEFAEVLDVPVSYFFDEMPSSVLAGRPMSGRGRKGFGEAATPFEQEKDPLITRETLEVVRAYYKIRESRVRKRIFEKVKAVGAAMALSDRIVAAATTGGGMESTPDNTDMLNSLQIKFASRFVMSNRPDFSLAERMFSDNEVYRSRRMEGVKVG